MSETMISILQIIAFLFSTGTLIMIGMLGWFANALYSKITGMAETLVSIDRDLREHITGLCERVVRLETIQGITHNESGRRSGDHTENN